MATGKGEVVNGDGRDHMRIVVRTRSPEDGFNNGDEDEINEETSEEWDQVRLTEAREVKRKRDGEEETEVG